MAIARHKKTYNDGFISIMETKTIRNENKKVIGKKLALVMKLKFSELSFREQDIDFAKGIGGKLDAKVETLFPPNFKQKNIDKYTVKLRDENYSIIKTDHFKNNLYLYLQKVGGIVESNERTD